MVFGSRKEKELVMHCEGSREDGQMICSAKRDEEVVASMLIEFLPDGKPNLKDITGTNEDVRKLKEFAKNNTNATSNKSGELF